MHAQLTLADLATTRPGAARVFHRHQLDFCCQGRRTLEEACSHRGLDVEGLLAEIRAAEPEGEELTVWTERSIDELIEHILVRYHAPLREELPRLIGLAMKVEATHREADGVPAGLAAHLRQMAEEIEEHLQKEEQLLFPMLRSGFQQAAAAPISVLHKEHDDHGRNLEIMRRLAHDYTPPADACTSWRALYAGVADLERELMEHIHLENNVLFPRVLRG